MCHFINNLGTKSRRRIECINTIQLIDATRLKLDKNNTIHVGSYQEVINE
ncbi:hypothetical protein N9E74_01305 [Candidatus Pseudothioglobus singularis]|nr:hypothetical protein [Candidatus Pseudothioglobus singularis]